MSAGLNGLSNRPFRFYKKGLLCVLGAFAVQGLKTFLTARFAQDAKIAKNSVKFPKTDNRLPTTAYLLTFSPSDHLNITLTLPRLWHPIKSD